MTFNVPLALHLLLLSVPSSVAFRLSNLREEFQNTTFPDLFDTVKTCRDEVLNLWTQNDELIKCMLEHILTSDASLFTDIMDSAVNNPCSIPGFRNMADACDNSLAPAALEHCNALLDLPTPAPSMQFSYSYDDTFADNEFGIVPSVADPNDTFCSIMTELVSEEMEVCMGTICIVGTSVPANGPTSSPTNDPTSSPTNESTSDAATSTPASEATAAPSTGSTLEPTSSTSEPAHSPTSGPTFIPTSSPIEVPAQPPTEQPTSAPTSTPTLVPTPGTTLDPSYTPTIEPTKGPAFVPTGANTSSVEATFLSTFRLRKVNLPVGGIGSVSPKELGGVSLLRRDRALQDASESLDVEYLATFSWACDSISCEGASSLAMDRYDDTTSRIKGAMETGVFERFLTVLATSDNVTAFMDISTDEPAFEELITTVTVSLPASGDDDDDELTPSSSASSCAIAQALLGAGISMAAMQFM
eukprot:CAMPEP_0118705542 /NCGR_PEP_ID=MMETSP0800-20121206/19923_1 /TAXON_ID=210618 ORGANISM="Striatella unipunctata, Strain CCMP2910" /NCGR_SAMPLE_ID=MMETSP0800 /ASSEMBLY_ACC=CAM_ASM_000638 /LENGTH=471 /DNA_ID=CAMNT_0006607703 /DNA_START=279 /DNA_END=1694 /DNA_ORIENTATION=+